MTSSLIRCCTFADDSAASLRRPDSASLRRTGDAAGHVEKEATTGGRGDGAADDRIAKMGLDELRDQLKKTKREVSMSDISCWQTFRRQNVHFSPRVASLHASILSGQRHRSAITLVRDRTLGQKWAGCNLTSLRCVSSLWAHTANRCRTEILHSKRFNATMRPSPRCTKRAKR